MLHQENLSFFLWEKKAPSHFSLDCTSLSPPLPPPNFTGEKGGGRWEGNLIANKNTNKNKTKQNPTKNKTETKSSKNRKPKTQKPKQTNKQNPQTKTNKMHLLNQYQFFQRVLVWLRQELMHAMSVHFIIACALQCCNHCQVSFASSIAILKCEQKLPESRSLSVVHQIYTNWHVK